MSRENAMHWPARDGEWTPERLRYWVAEIERVKRARTYRWWSPRDRLMLAHLNEELHEKRRHLAALTGQPAELRPAPRAQRRPPLGAFARYRLSA